jgi:hypothetical protein
MFTARRKIQKEKGQEPDEFEESVAQVRLRGSGLVCQYFYFEQLQMLVCTLTGTSNLTAHW